MADICIDCGAFYELEDGETNFFLREGLSLPKRCHYCRAIRRGIEDRKSICKRCGKPFIIPREFLLFARTYPEFKIPVVCIGGCGKIKFDIKHIPTFFERIILNLFGLEKTREIVEKGTSRLESLPYFPRIYNFQKCAAIDNQGIRIFLFVSFPEKILKEIRSISYSGNVFSIRRKGMFFIERGNISFYDKQPVDILINRQHVERSDTAFDIKWAICHEVGHIVYRKFLTEEEKADWYSLFEEQYEEYTTEARENDERMQAFCRLDKRINKNLI